MSSSCRQLLTELAACERGKGLQLPPRTAGAAYAMSQGWIYRLSVHGLVVTLITDAGRAALEQEGVRGGK
jgi:hypothetical protein